MNNFANEILKRLIDLKENYNISGIKTEFEAEGACFEEAEFLGNIVKQAGLDFVVKIGGCEAITDLIQAKKLNAHTIVAPMIETPYAMKKFVNALQNVFENERLPKLFINIETITGFNNLNDIISSDEFEQISGIVLGRFDMISSLGKTRKDVNCEQILNIAKIISEKMKLLNKEFVVGGSVSNQSIPFFEKLNYLSKFETRKVVFEAQNILSNPNIEMGIIKSIEFEKFWIKNKQEFFAIDKQRDLKRLEILEQIL